MQARDYLALVAAETATDWCNDSAMPDDLTSALDRGAVGCTTNPPLSFQALCDAPAAFAAAIAEVDAAARAEGFADGEFPPAGDARAEALVTAVVRTVSRRLLPLWRSSEGRVGYVRAQVQPSLARDADAMLAMGKRFASIGPNVMVKIPGSTAGIATLEELAALGIPTTPTVCLTVAQMAAVAEANERGRERAARSGLEPAPSTAAIVIGRTQDYLAGLASRRGVDVSTADLEVAVTAIARRCIELFRERGYRQVVMPAAFRSPEQVAALVGEPVQMTIHPRIQREVSRAYAEGRIDLSPAVGAAVEDAGEDAVERVARALPEFREAYALPGEPDALTVDRFDDYPGLGMVLDAFDATGWKKLTTLVPRDVPGGEMRV